MLRFFALLVIVLMLPVRVTAAYVDSTSGTSGSGCEHQVPSTVICHCDHVESCAMHLATATGASHGTAQHHHCLHMGTGAAVIPVVPAAPVIPPANACPESERVSFHSIVLDVPSPPPTCLA